ncbi:MAG: YdeI/OmpD-associated family protein [Candidatus Eremiobacteraeota bacterium]|nr:YdeI/OmpD-associated family protein [Candidatus Eremiobacteraeota bacterium]
MGTKDPRVDAYITKSPDFAKPILTQLRDAVHATCPDVEESLKWSVPHFAYKGPFATMAAFKAHAGFGFWKGALVVEQQDASADKSAGQLGRLTSVADLPPKKVLAGYIKKAMKLNEDGVPAPSRRKRRAKDAPVDVPDALTRALAKNKKARAAFDAFTPARRRDYAEWIASAKADDTRARRIEQAIQWISEGKPRNWKYMT